MKNESLCCEGFPSSKSRPLTPLIRPRNMPLPRLRCSPSGPLRSRLDIIAAPRRRLSMAIPLPLKLLQQRPRQVRGRIAHHAGRAGGGVVGVEGEVGVDLEVEVVGHREYRGVYVTVPAQGGSEQMELKLSK